MRFQQYHYRWIWDLASSPDQLWDWIADTNRFNRDTSIPPVQPLFDGPKLEPMHRRLRLRKLGVSLEWEEAPFEWVRPHRFGVLRSYKTGPIAEMRVLVELQPLPTGGSRLIYQIWATPSGLLGALAIPIQIGWLSARAFEQTFRRYDRILSLRAQAPEPPAKVRLEPGAQERMAALSARLKEEGATAELVDRLLETIEQSDDFTAARLRPYALADAWGKERSAVLDLCLLATRTGLLDFRWELLCPLCRGASKRTTSLGQIDSQVHCPGCNIDFKANFDRSVELTFRPNPALRSSLEQVFCFGGPQFTPHIVLQQSLGPGERRTVQAPLESGRYRLRTPTLEGGLFLLATAEAPNEVLLRAEPNGWPNQEPTLSLRPSLLLENATDARQIFILERMAWSDQAVTAAEVTTRQSFRDLFSREALRPGEKISVGNVTILFTDLRGSTPLYRELGDAPAFGLVMEHFDVLREAIAAEGGAIVKTIGDAVMGVFLRPAAGLRAMLRAQRELAAPVEGRRPLGLKAGLHSGPCIAVTLNERLDYFGSTVNLAARLEGLSTGVDIIVSEPIHSDPEVAAWLQSPESNLTAQPFEASLKGFDQERFRLWRISASIPAKP